MINGNNKIIKFVRLLKFVRICDLKKIIQFALSVYALYSTNTTTGLYMPVCIAGHFRYCRTLLLPSHDS